MLEFFGATTRQHRTVAQTQVRSIIENRDIAFAEQTRDSAKCAAESAIEKHRVFAIEKFCDLTFEFAMKIGHAGEHGRTACTKAVGIERFVRGGDDVGVIR